MFRSGIKTIRAVIKNYSGANMKSYQKQYIALYRAYLPYYVAYR